MICSARFNIKQPFAVRRIAQYQSGIPLRTKNLQVRHLRGNAVPNAGCTGIELGQLHARRINIPAQPAKAAVRPFQFFSAAAFLCPGSFRYGIPFHRRKTAADTGCDPLCGKRRFNQQRAGTAAGIDHLLGKARFGQIRNRRGERFLNRRPARLRTITPLMQTGTAGYPAAVLLRPAAE